MSGIDAGAELTILVMVKEPVPGRVKTRLTPPLSPTEAAECARACIADTLAATLARPASRTVVMLDGSPGSWLPPEVTVIPQQGHGLAERLAHAFSCVQGPALVIGMDTPQVSSALLWPDLSHDPADAVLGHAHDGGYWALGMREPDPRIFEGVPMSTDRTGAIQWTALQARCARPRELPMLRDLDTITDAIAIAREYPDLAVSQLLDSHVAAAP